VVLGHPGVSLHRETPWDKTQKASKAESARGKKNSQVSAKELAMWESPIKALLGIWLIGSLLAMSAGSPGVSPVLAQAVDSTAVMAQPALVSREEPVAVKEVWLNFSDAHVSEQSSLTSGPALYQEKSSPWGPEGGGKRRSAQSFASPIPQVEATLGISPEEAQHTTRSLRRSADVFAPRSLLQRLPGASHATPISDIFRKERTRAFPPQVGGKAVTLSSPVVLFFAALGAGVAVGVLAAKTISPDSSHPRSH